MTLDEALAASSETQALGFKREFLALPVGALAVFDLRDGDGRGRLVDLVDDSVLSDSGSVESLETLELLRSERSGVFSQGKNLRVGALENFFGELVEVLPGGPGDNQPIGQSET
ncbi:MAG: hypothetical protein ACRD1P_07270 [Thermoanaerobaculia bacterium]